MVDLIHKFELSEKVFTYLSKGIDAIKSRAEKSGTLHTEELNPAFSKAEILRMRIDEDVVKISKKMLEMLGEGTISSDEISDLSVMVLGFKENVDTFEEYYITVKKEPFVKSDW